MNVTKFKLLLVGIGVISLFILLWVSSVGYIQVTVSGNEGATKYTLVKQNGDTYTVSESTVNRFNKMVKKGTYRVQVESNGKSYIALAQTKGFFGKTEVSASLKPESSREFVGDNPAFCMHYNQNLLYSFNCTVPGGLTIHMPASDETPTTTLSETEPPYIPLVDIISVSGVSKALAVDDEDGHVGLYDIDNELRLVNPVDLDEIKAGQANGIVAYKTGFITYSKNFKEIKYFASLSSRPSAVKISSPADGINNPVELSVYDDTIGALFNSGEGSDEGLDADAGHVEEKSGKSEMIVHDQRGSRKYEFNKIYTSGGLCADSKVCLIGSGLLDIYDIKDEKPVYLFSVKDAQKTLSVGKNIVIATDKKVISLDQDKLLGYIQYNHGDGGYCGISRSGTGYVLCHINPKGKKVALYVSPATPDGDSIDKKVFALLKDPNVVDVSAYKNYIYISPNLGSLVLDSQGNLNYDPVIKQSTNKKIDELIKNSGIDTSRYKVINPFKN